MHKTNLQKRMRELGACAAASAWVAAHPSNDAATIWRDCQRVDWLTWFFGRVRPKLAAKFAFACADRAVRVHAAKRHPQFAELPPVVDSESALKARAAANAAANAYYAAGYAYHAADAAANSAADAAASAAAHAAANSAANAANAADNAANAASAAAERSDQLRALHAWADNWR